MQTLFRNIGFSNIGSLIGAFRSMEKPSSAIQNITLNKAARHEDTSLEERLPQRDESWYWAMHAHW